LILDANPLEDIRNLWKLSTVMRDGRVIDRAKLPERRVLSPVPAPRPAVKTSQDPRSVRL
jgi:hypothetical protein